MSNLGPILKTIKDQYQIDWFGYHGVRHWARVRHHSMLIRNRRHLQDDALRVVELFALFHDACRVNEHEGPEHGDRGAKLAHSMRDQWNRWRTA